MPATKEPIAIIGLGYVGLPLALAFVEAGQPVIGIDTDQEKVLQLRQGTTYLNHLGPERILNALEHGLRPTYDYAAIAACHAVIICVPTPLNDQLQPDLQYIEDTTLAIAPHLSANTLVVLESTTWPGTTREVVQVLLEANGYRRLGTDLFIAFSPEREDPGNATFTTTKIPKIIGGLDEASLSRATELYQHIFNEIVPVASTDIAEAAKITENVFRAVNIALVNELKIVFDAMDIDINQVIDAAATKPFGYMPFRPGPGLGGHCIPIDPFYLSWRARSFGVTSKFIELAGEINRAMPNYVINKVKEALRLQNIPLQSARVCVLGLAYKANVDDLRESPSLVLLDTLNQMQVDVSWCDPYFSTIPPTRQFNHLTDIAPEEPSANHHVLILATNHSSFDPQALLALETLIIDTRNHFPDHPRVIRA